MRLDTRIATSCQTDVRSQVGGQALSSGDLVNPSANSLCRVFDHIGIAVSDLAASERFYRTVLSVLGVEPSHADAELVEWDDWAIGPTDREHRVTRGLHVGFRAPTREAVDAFWPAFTTSRSSTTTAERCKRSSPCRETLCRRQRTAMTPLYGAECRSGWCFQADGAACTIFATGSSTPAPRPPPP